MHAEEDRLDRALRRLPPERRMALVLCYEEERSPDEVARLLREPEHVVRRWLAEGLEQLAWLLDEEADAS